MKKLLQDLDKAFETKVRLGIMSALIVNESLNFSSLKELLEVTDGNLATHLKFLEKYKYVESYKEFLNKKPNTSYSVTVIGHDAFVKHIKAIERMLN